ncbi:hypothetical protein [Halocatena marina]|nr:hypothetical protein [Halocatena marina]
MPEENESPSTGWRDVYDAMGVSTTAEDTDSNGSRPPMIRPP